MSEPKTAGMFGGQTSNGLVLVVDDEPDVRKVVRMTLEKAGYHVIEAEDGEQAINLLKTGDNLVNCGLILCDIRMPKVNGIECIEYFRDQAPGIPIVVITGYPETELAVELMKKGVKDYLVKPIEGEKLLEIVNKHVSAGKETNF